MRRGTTPTHTFTLRLDPDVISRVQITYQQYRRIVLVRDTINPEDIKMEGNVAVVDLTQEETLLFDENAEVEIQVRVLAQNNKALASKIFTVRSVRILNEEVLR